MFSGILSSFDSWMNVYLSSLKLFCFQSLQPTWISFYLSNEGSAPELELNYSSFFIMKTSLRILNRVQGKQGCVELNTHLSKKSASHQITKKSRKTGMHVFWARFWTTMHIRHKMSYLQVSLFVLLFIKTSSHITYMTIEFIQFIWSIL